MSVTNTRWQSPEVVRDLDNGGVDTASHPCRVTPEPLSELGTSVLCGTSHYSPQRRLPGSQV